jgi:uncharacterized membrane protein
MEPEREGSPSLRPCPHCGSLVQVAARRCPQCHHDLEAVDAAVDLRAPRELRKSPDPERSTNLTLVLGVACLLMAMLAVGGCVVWVSRMFRGVPGGF